MPSRSQLFLAEDLQTPSHDVAPLQAESGGTHGAKVPDMSYPQRAGWDQQDAGTTFTSSTLPTGSLLHCQDCVMLMLVGRTQPCSKLLLLMG